MITIIGGAPKSGKSYLAKRIAKKTLAERIEIDVIMPSFNALIPKTQQAERLPVWRAKSQGDEPTYANYRTEALTYWPAIRAMLNFLLVHRAEDSYVIEGAQILPANLKAWVEELDNNHAKAIRVILLDGGQTVYYRGLAAEAKENGFSLTSRDDANASV